MPAGVPVLPVGAGAGVLAPPPQAVCSKQPPITRKTRQQASTFVFFWVFSPPVLSNIAGISRPKASHMPEPGLMMAGTRAADAPAAVTVNFAAPTSFETEIEATEQVSAGFTCGVTVHVRPTFAGLNPFEGVMVMLELAEEPADTEGGDKAPADSPKPALIATTLDVLVLKFPSPL